MSSHLRSLERRTLVFGVLAVVLGAVLWLMPDASTSVKKESLPLVFPDFEKDSVKRVEITRGQAKIILQQGSDQAWFLDSHFRYPLGSPPDRLLDAIGSARIISEVTRRQDTFGKYAGGKGWIQVAAVDNRGRETVRFGIGRYKYPETFLRLGDGDDARVIKASSISETQASLETRMWIETRMWPSLSAASMVRMDVEQRADGRTITIVRRGESPADVEMAVPEKDEKGEKVYWMASPFQGDAKKMAVDDLAREFTGMLIQDVVAGSVTEADEAKYGFDKPEVVATFSEKAGGQVTKHTLTVGKRVENEERWYVRRANESWVFLVDASSGVSRLRQPPEEFRAKKEDAKKGAAEKPK